MLFEDLLIVLAIGISIFFIGMPLFKLMKITLFPTKPNPLKEARMRLETAKQEAEAAKLNQQTEKIIKELYEDLLNENDEKEKNHK